MTDGALQGLRAAVTGGASGIGRASALALAGAGAELVLLDRAPADESVAAVTALGGSARALEVDVTDRDAVFDAMDDVAGGDARIDVLVACAGVYGEAPPFDDLTKADLDRTLTVNVHGVVWSIQAVLPYMRRTGGQIVVLGSAAGKLGGLVAGADYVASKGAVHAVTKLVARVEAPNGIRANAIAAGAVQTPMIAGREYPPSYCPLNRIAEPEEIAAAVLFLASPASSYVTGTVMDVSGGYVMS